MSPKGKFDIVDYIFNFYSILEVNCYYRDTKSSRVLIGSFETTYERLRIGPTISNVYTVSYVTIVIYFFQLTYRNSKHQTKVCGEFELIKFNEMVLPSFLEFISTGYVPFKVLIVACYRTIVNVTFAIDFTQSEDAVDQQVIQQYMNDVELAVRSVGEPIRDYNATSSFAAFGFGAKIPPHYRESQEFCLVSLNCNSIIIVF